MSKANGQRVTKLLRIDEIKPYWRNPRDNHAAVEKVKQSISNYGYNQLIAVDEKNVIIVGHTRYPALKELGWLEVTVLVLPLTPKQAKAYRIVDNKTSEIATWTDALLVELREIDDAAEMQPFFGEDLVKLLSHDMGADGGLEATTEQQVQVMDEAMRARFGHGNGKDMEQEVTCPACGVQFFIKR
jgi:ParB-like chromosome segregation protein Spo0J